MRFLFAPLNEQDQKLEKFRQSFRILTSDGQFPYERQQRLFQACRKAGLDWKEARRFIQADARAFLGRVVEQIITDKHITPDEIAEVRRLQRRLDLADEHMIPFLERLYDLVEHKIEKAIIEHAAYLSEASLVDTLKHRVIASKSQHLVIFHRTRMFLAKLLGAS